VEETAGAAPNIFTYPQSNQGAVKNKFFNSPLHAFSLGSSFSPPKHFRQRKITASARSKLPYLRKNRENIIEKIFLKKSKNTIDKRLAAVYNTVKRLNKYSNVQKNRRRGGCPSGKVI
jgi:hypothetical protein